MSKRGAAELSALHIWPAVTAGDLPLLQHLIQAGVPKGKFKNQVDNNHWTLLHHAVMSRNVEVVKLVTNTFKLNFRARNNNNLTPLMLACIDKCPVEIITHLMERMGKPFDEPSPLECAVNQHRIDLLKAVIPLEAKSKSKYVKRAHAALQRMTTADGDPEVLQCLLDGPYCVGNYFLKKKKGPFTEMEQFAHFGPHDAHKKVECFKILFNILHPIPNPTVGRRYNVNDILLLALRSTTMTSLIPHLIETEQKWEQRPLIRSLYERLLPKYELLALMVLCECGPVTIERKRLERILEEFCCPQFRRYWYQELMIAYVNASKLTDEVRSSPMEALELLEDFAAFGKTIQLPFFRKFVRECVIKVFCESPIEPGVRYNSRHHRAVESMMILYNNAADYIIQRLIAQKDRHERAILIFPLLRHCVTLLMGPTSNGFGVLRGYRLWYWFVYLFGTWDTIEWLPIGYPVKQVFSLKRIARDAVRETILHEMTEADERYSFFERLHRLGLPNELEEYVRYSGTDSILYFLEHMESVRRWLFTEAEE